MLINRLAKSVQFEISCDELILKEIQEDSIKINPGILGCGILTCNLSRQSTEKIEEFASLLVELYHNSKFDGVNGEIYHDSIIKNQG